MEEYLRVCAEPGRELGLEGPGAGRDTFLSSGVDVAAVESKTAEIEFGHLCEGEKL